MATYTTNQDEWHSFDCRGHKFTVPIRYQDPVFIAAGGFSVVIRAIDTTTGKSVAIKKNHDALQSRIHAKRIYRELKLLMYLNHPDVGIVRLYNVFTSERNPEEFQTLYFVVNFANYNLHDVIRYQQSFAEEHIKLIIYQILRGLKFIHSAGVVHGDLNTWKIGIDKVLNITILNFASTYLLRDYFDDSYVPARWWCAPELYVVNDPLTDKNDIWSVGSIMAELILLRPAFRGSDSIDQLNKIFDIIGTPDTATLNEICMPAATNYISQLPSKSKQDFNQLFGFKYDAVTQTPISGVSPQGVDLLDRLLSFDHRKRPTATEALAHPFFGYLREPSDEPSIEPLIDEHQSEDHTIEMWRSLIWQMIEEFEPPSWINDDSDGD